MTIEQDLQTGFNHNRHFILITDADELLAAWLYKRCHSGRTSNLSAVPAKWRLSCPPSENTPTVPCHVTTRHQAGKIVTGITGSTMNCHGQGAIKQPAGNIVPLDSSALEVVQDLHKMSKLHSPVMDTLTLARIGKELGYSRVVSKIINGRQYLAVTGYAGKRSIITGTLYKPTNPKIINMGIGWRGAASQAAKGGMIAIYITVPFRIAEHMLSDDKCRYKLFENVASDVLQIGAGAIAFIAVAGFGMAMGAPVIAVVGAGMAVSLIVGKMTERVLTDSKIIQHISDTLRDMRDGRHEWTGKMKFI